jgi:hypothetical protein
MAIEAAEKAGRIKEALAASVHALRDAPRCPRLLWLHANLLHRVGLRDEAWSTYTVIARGGMRFLSRSCCCKHKALARGLIADAFLHISLILKAMRLPARHDAFEAHLDLRGPGCYSVYTLGHLPDSEGDLTLYRAWPNTGMHPTRSARG